MPTTISARLDKAWNEADMGALYRVLCGRLQENGAYGCGGELGSLICWAPKQPGDASWNLWFGPVMMRNVDGVWQLTSRAGRRLRHVIHLASDPATPPPVRERARRLLERGVHYLHFMTIKLYESPDGIEEESDPELPMRRSGLAKDLPRAHLPCEVRCPRCAGVNVVPIELISQARGKIADEEKWYRDSQLP